MVVRRLHSSTSLLEDWLKLRSGCGVLGEFSALSGVEGS